MSSKQVVADPRLKAIVGYVPYFGQSFLPGIRARSERTGRIQRSVSGYLADSPIRPLRSGRRSRVSNASPIRANWSDSVGVEHGFDVPSAPDIFTWTLTFLAAHVNDDRLARAHIARMISVRGGGDDAFSSTTPRLRHRSAGERAGHRILQRWLDDYFLTAFAGEAAQLDAGNVVAGWSRTGYEFKAFAASRRHGIACVPIFGTPGTDLTRISTPSIAAECAFVKTVPDWIYKGNAVRGAIRPLRAIVAAGRCR